MGDAAGRPDGRPPAAARPWRSHARSRRTRSPRPGCRVASWAIRSRIARSASASLPATLAMRPPARTALAAPEYDFSAEPISRMPNTIMKRMGSTMAASTSTAPRSSRARRRRAGGGPELDLGHDRPPAAAATLAYGMLRASASRLRLEGTGRLRPCTQRLTVASVVPVRRARSAERSPSSRWRDRMSSPRLVDAARRGSAAARDAVSTDSACGQAGELRRRRHPVAELPRHHRARRDAERLGQPGPAQPQLLAASADELAEGRPPGGVDDERRRAQRGDVDARRSRGSSARVSNRWAPGVERPVSHPA